MTPYIDVRRFPVTCEYGTPRPTPTNPGRVHGGRDHGCPRGTPLFAAEAGWLQLAVIRHAGDVTFPNSELTWPDGTWWPYSKYFEHNNGGLAILWGEQYTHVFLHLDPSWIYRRCEQALVPLIPDKRRKPGDYSSYVLAEVVWQPWAVREGDVIAVTGISGYDDGPHVHYQCMEKGRNKHVVLDPRETLRGVLV